MSSEATLNLLTREALELHFEGVTYGPIEHTQALGLLLFALRPGRVRCATPRGAFQAAMQSVLAAAQDTADLLGSWAEDAAGSHAVRDPRWAHLPAWLDAGCRAVPAHRAESFRAALNERLPVDPCRTVLH